jgi:hypothetical protein
VLNTPAWCAAVLFTLFHVMQRNVYLLFKKFLTSDPPLKETVLGVFDLAEIVAGGSKNKQIDGFCAKFFAKSIAKNRNRLAFVVWEIFKKN